ncbi:repeat protein [Cotonvirus japonicus]|uniref:Repeat protein n=1 Tax=Cotonvirus japonicus TaxID=2811091 RepID=A0ABM7NTC2_9VIRU|nr:repeat protein [Cotonvirus japonicus]BCS83413.1 repeat protein [Cotonvirus japonicus]
MNDNVNEVEIYINHYSFEKSFYDKRLSSFGLIVGNDGLLYNKFNSEPFVITNSTSHFFTDLVKYLVCIDDLKNFLKYIHNDSYKYEFEDNIFIKIAVVNKSYSILNHLFNSGIKISACNNIAIKLACKIFDMDMIKYLINRGADICCDNNLCIKLACSHNNRNYLEFLIEKGADILTAGDFVMDHSISNYNFVIINFLEELGFNPTNYSSFKRYFRCAVQYGDYEIIIKMLEKGANFDMLKEEDIIACIKTKDYSTIKLLIDNKVNLQFINDYKFSKGENECNIFNLLLNENISCDKIIKIFYSDYKIIND